MILVTLGTQKFQFDRLLQAIDRLIIDGTIKEEVIVQAGSSTYTSKNFKSFRSFSPEEMKKRQEAASLIITHGGTGSIIEPLKMKKKVIAVPRLAKYGEHVDDHQIEIVDELAEAGYIIGIKEMKDLKMAIKEVCVFTFKNYENNGQNELIDAIRSAIRS